MEPSPPSQTGLSFTYKGIGIGYAFSEEEDPSKLSKYEGLSYQIPIKNVLIQASHTNIEGAEVTDRGHVEDIETESVNVGFSWSPEVFKFSCFLGLTDAVGLKGKKTESLVFII